MAETIIQITIGLILVAGGIVCALGKLSVLHSYHIKRVKEEDVRPFGKAVGSGLIISGLSIISTGIVELFSPDIADLISVVGLALGSIIVMYALFKYNKGIF